MHDIDRTQREFESAIHELQPEHFEYSHEQEMYGEAEEIAHEGEQYEGEMGEHEAVGEFEGMLTEYGHEAGPYEGEFQEIGMHESPLHEGEEMELAAEFLEVTNEAELDRFLGRLIKRAWRGIRRAAPGLLRTVGGYLRPLAKAALPIAGKAVGTFFGGPLGGVVGGKLASAAGNLFGLELEGLSGEDREFEVARRFVRFASTAARQAAAAPAYTNPTMAARSALIGAARRWAPGYVRRRVGYAGGGYAYPGPYPEPYPVQTDGEPLPRGSTRRGIWARRRP